jgi:hypothetical protein
VRARARFVLKGTREQMWCVEGGNNVQAMLLYNMGRESGEDHPRQRSENQAMVSRRVLQHRLEYCRRCCLLRTRERRLRRPWGRERVSRGVPNITSLFISLFFLRTTALFFFILPPWATTLSKQDLAYPRIPIYHSKSHHNPPPVIPT